VVPGFSGRDLVAVFTNYNEVGVERRLVLCSAYLTYDSEETPLTKEFEDLVRYCEKENLYLALGCDSNAHHSAWSSTNCNSRREALIEYLYTTNLEILNLGNEPTFCSVGKLEVIDITLGYLRFLNSFTGSEVSSETFLSHHRLILFTLQCSIPVRLIRNRSGNNWGSFIKL
jgi:hypothetical protein